MGRRTKRLRSPTVEHLIQHTWNPCLGNYRKTFIFTFTYSVWMSTGSFFNNSTIIFNLIWYEKTNVLCFEMHFH